MLSYSKQAVGLLILLLLLGVNAMASEKEIEARNRR